MFRTLARFVLLAVSTFFAPATGPAYWDFHRQMDRSWEISQEEVDDAIYSLPTHEAYTVLYVQSGGNNTFSGTTTSNSAAESDVGGTYSQGGGAGGNDLYTASSGTPLSGASIGDWASIFTAASASTTFVGQITAVNGSGASIDISLTAIYGTRPANASTKSCNIGGAWVDVTGSIPTGSSTIPGSTQVCVKVSTLTLSGNLTLGLKGTTSLQLWYRGYNTTIGDLDNGSTSLTYPSIVASTHVVTVSGNSVIISAFRITGAVNNLLTLSGTTVECYHVSVQSTLTGGSSTAVFMSSGNCSLTCCYVSVAGASAAVFCGPNATIIGCTITSSASSTTSQVGISSGYSLVVMRCSISGVSGDGILCVANAAFTIVANVISNCGRDGVRFTNFGWGTAIASNYFYKSGGYNINNQTGSVPQTILLANNCNNQATSGHMSGFGDQTELGATSPGVAALTESLTPPFVSSTNLQLLATSVGAGAALPGQWENQTAGLGGFGDVGAWQRLAGSGSGGGANLLGEGTLVAGG